VTKIHADIEALKGFREALVRFRYAERGVTERADDAIEMTRTSLAAKASRWQAQLEQDQAALEACRASSMAGDGPPDCSAYVRAVELTTERLEHVRRWQQRVDQDASEFRGTAGGFRDLLEVDLPRAEARLLASITSLEAARRVEAG
jgi:hypothetical protein